MVGVSRCTVAEYLAVPRLWSHVVDITWLVAVPLDDAALECKLFTLPFAPAEAQRLLPNRARVHAQLRCSWRDIPAAAGGVLSRATGW